MEVIYSKPLLKAEVTWKMDQSMQGLVHAWFLYLKVQKFPSLSGQSVPDKNTITKQRI